MKIVAVSDVTLGYGSPQLPLLVESLRDFYRGEAHVIEPVQPELAPRHAQFDGFRFHRVLTAEHPHSTIGRKEYIWRAAKMAQALQADVFVVCCTYSLPVLYRLTKRPRRVIYYSIESIPFYGEFDIEMNRRAAPLLDAIIFPEENRAVLETARCGFPNVPKFVFYNVSNRRKDSRPPRPDRNGRMLYSGTISATQTFANYYLSHTVQTSPIDIFGPVKGSDAEKRRFLDGLGGAVHYRGMVSATELAQLRPAYVYSIVAWNPNVENQLYAAPNKFFESIADGVPPIAAPHPQCKLILERYGCGVLMQDWSFDSFCAALRKAGDLYGTEAWHRMVENCGVAVARELTWDAQFDKLKPVL